MKNWPGIGNKLRTISGRALQRRGEDLPEYIEKHMLDEYPIEGRAVKQQWVNGIVDIKVEKGKFSIRKVEEGKSLGG